MSKIRGLLSREHAKKVDALYEKRVNSSTMENYVVNSGKQPARPLGWHQTCCWPN